MIYLSGLVGFLLMLTAEAKVGNSSQLSFCIDTEQCLLFDLVCKTDQYEVRHYSSAKWVTTEEESYFTEMAIMTAFKRLFKYITGANENGSKIQMTAPVIIKMQDRNKRFWETATYTMSFLLPSEHQKNPPKPTDNKVNITDMPDMKVYVRSYGGWMTRWADRSHSGDLRSALDTADLKYKDFHYAVGYNRPTTLFNRHNEVWIVAKGDAECASSEEMDISPMF